MMHPDAESRGREEEMGLPPLYPPKIHAHTAQTPPPDTLTEVEVGAEVSRSSIGGKGAQTLTIFFTKFFLLVVRPCRASLSVDSLSPFHSFQRPLNLFQILLFYGTCYAYVCAPEFPRCGVARLLSAAESFALLLRDQASGGATRHGHHTAKCNAYWRGTPHTLYAESPYQAPASLMSHGRSRAGTGCSSSVRSLVFVAYISSFFSLYIIIINKQKRDCTGLIFICLIPFSCLGLYAAALSSFVSSKVFFASQERSSLVVVGVSVSGAGQPCIVHRIQFTPQRSRPLEGGGGAGPTPVRRRHRDMVPPPPTEEGQQGVGGAASPLGERALRRRMRRRAAALQGSLPQPDDASPEPKRPAPAGGEGDGGPLPPPPVLSTPTPNGSPESVVAAGAGGPVTGSPAAHPIASPLSVKRASGGKTDSTNQNNNNNNNSGAGASSSTPSGPTGGQPKPKGQDTAQAPVPAPAPAHPPAALGPTPNPMAVRRETFESLDFNADAFCNEMIHRVLSHALSSVQLQGEPGALRGSPTSHPITTPVSGNSTAGAPLGGGAAAGVRGSDGKDLFSSVNIPVFARRGGGAPLAGGSGPPSPAEAQRRGFFLQIAERLSGVLRQSLQQVNALQASVERARRAKEVRGKRIEVNEKRRLADIRAGLEETTSRLQAYETRVENAQAATAGIEQHLAQSNARVQRGKAVSQLLRHFRTISGLDPGSLASALQGLSRSRAIQRRAVTAQWETRGAPALVTPPPFYEDPPTTQELAEAAARSHSRTSSEGGLRRRRRGDDAAQQSPAATAAPRRTEEGGDGKKKRVVRRRKRLGEGEKDSRAPAPAESNRRSRRRGNTSAGDAGGDSQQTRKEAAAGSAVSDEVAVRRAEASAVGCGLDRLFVARANTELQVEWSQRLLLLAAELEEVAPHARNIQQYAEWLKQELVADLFHVVGRFNALYTRFPTRAAHLPLGRAFLRTLELTSRLFVTLAASSDDLLAVFFAHAINDIGVTLHSDYSPTPFPGAPPPPAPSNVLAMDHFAEHLEAELPKSFTFLVERVRREVLVVESMVGLHRTARQQLLSQVIEKVIKPFIVQQMQRAEKHRDMFLEAEEPLSPRSKRKSAVRVVDALRYYHAVSVSLLNFFHSVQQELTKELDPGEGDFVQQFSDAIFFHSRERYSQRREELDLMRRCFTLLDEKYTRALHPVPEEFFDLREAHMTKSKALIEVLMEVTTRIRTFALEKDSVAYTLDAIKLGLQQIVPYFEGELKKTLESVRLDKDRWRVKPKSEEELLRPSKPESQHCGFRMLLFVQTGLIMLQDALQAVCRPLLHRSPRLHIEVERARAQACAGLDDVAEKLLNLCVAAILTKSLSVLQHYQSKSDFLPSDKTPSGSGSGASGTNHKSSSGGGGTNVAPPCTRACTLFCYYVTRQLAEAKEFIRLSELRHSSGTKAQGMAAAELGAQRQEAALSAPPSQWRSEGELARAKARTMSMTELLYGDGEPSTFVRTLGVCLYRGIGAHLKSFVVNDRGALVYKQDVTAYAEAVRPLSASPTLGGAVVGVLFQMLRETSSLLVVPLNNIKDVKDSGLLQVMGRNEKLSFLKIRQDVRTAFKAIQK
eukprot:gene9955-6950_t